MYRVLISQNVLPFVAFGERADFYLGPLGFVSRFRAKGLLKRASLDRRRSNAVEVAEKAGVEEPEVLLQDRQARWVAVPWGRDTSFGSAEGYRFR